MSQRWGVRLATPADAAELLALYECDAAPGAWSLLSTRRPDPVASLAGEGERAVVPVVTDLQTGRLVGMGAVVVRDAWVGERRRRVGYLTGLKILPEFRRRLPLFPAVYGRLRELTDDVELYYTSILAENTAAQRLLERRRPGMPEYRKAGDYTTWFFRPLPRPTGLRLTRAEASGEQGRPRLDLAPLRPLTSARWELRTRDGELVASAGVWDQRASRQYVVTAYSGRLRWASRLPTHWAGYPRLPAAGVAIPCAAVTDLWVRGWDGPTARTFLTLLAGAHRHLDFLMWGAHASHPLTPALACLPALHLASRLYTVHFDASCRGLDGRPVGLEVALL